MIHIPISEKNSGNNSGVKIEISNQKPFVVLGGMNVLESLSLAEEVCGHFVEVTKELGIPYIFKASFDKANRSSIHSFRGPGLEKGLEWLASIKKKYGVPVITDVHEPSQAKDVAKVCDILQLPAFLARQTDLVVALAQTGKPIQIKKPQFLAPKEMAHTVTKLAEAGNKQAILCERGTCFGYNNLVVDTLGLDIMKNMGHPVTFDVTHALQQPGARADSAGGRAEQIQALALSAMAQGLAGLFIEAHPNPKAAKCDGPCALPLGKLKDLLAQLSQLDKLVKTFPKLNTV
jgi:2-dehydro-3-deoxyphosphooctonate aldolase (KDO 8-P synthase)